MREGTFLPDFHWGHPQPPAKTLPGEAVSENPPPRNGKRVCFLFLQLTRTGVAIKPGATLVGNSRFQSPWAALIPGLCVPLNLGGLMPSVWELGSKESQHYGLHGGTSYSGWCLCGYLLYNSLNWSCLVCIFLCMGVFSASRSLLRYNLYPVKCTNLNSKMHKCSVNLYIIYTNNVFV